MEIIITYLKSFVDKIASNPYLGLLGLVVAIVSILYAFYLQKKNKKYKELSCALISNNLIKEKESHFPKLDISYNNEKLDNFTLTKIHIINIGKEVIRPQDIAAKDPIRFCATTDKTRLLDHSLIYANNPKNNFELNIQSEAINLSFDFIEPKDKVIIQVLHTGVDSNDIQIFGTVIGARKPFSGKDIVSTKIKGVNELILNSPKRVAFIMFFLFTLMFCFLSYAFKSNIFLLIICIFLALSSIRMLYKIAKTKMDAPKSMMASDFMQSMLVQIIDRLKPSDYLEEKNDVDK